MEWAFWNYDPCLMFGHSTDIIFFSSNVKHFLILFLMFCICVDAFVGIRNPFICDELHINGTEAAEFAEYLQRTIDNNMGNIYYF